MLVFLSAILLLSLPACGGSFSTTGDQLIKVRFSEVIHSIFYAPHYVAMGKGFFKGEGLHVDMVTSQGSDKGAAALLAGTADISLIGPETSIFVYNQRGQKTLKVFYQLTGTDGTVLMSRKKEDHFEWKDLEGKAIIGWRPGSAPNSVLKSVLRKNGVKNVTVIDNISSQAMVGAFESGKGDYIQVYEPIASTLEKAGKAYTVDALSWEIGAFPETSYEATSDFIDANPDVIQKWCNALYKATQWMNSHSAEEIATVLQPYFKETPKDIIVKSVDRYKHLKVWPESPVPTYQQLDILQDVLIENGIMKQGERVKYDAVIERSFAEKAVKGGK
jgi:NitT/TauT family transport system substrate-binding protein